MILSPAGLARWSSRRPRLVLGLWLATLILAVGAIAGLLGGALTSDDAVTASTESKRADALVFERRLVNPKPVDEIVIVRSGSLTVDEPAFRDFVRGLFAAGRAPGAVASARSWYETRDPSLVSGDRHATIVPIVLGPNGDEGIEKVVALVREADRDSRFSAAVTGSFTLDRDFNEVSQHDLKKGELAFGLPAALVILVLVFGALVAAVVPVTMAIASIVVALGLTALVGLAFDLSLFVVNMISGMGLALGIDYSLFVISRYREERRAGREKLDAIEAAGGTASRAVLFSGIAFIVALCGLLLVQDTIMRSLAAGAVLAGISSVAAALTLLPALLSLLGDRVNALRLPFVGRGSAPGARDEAGFWTAVVRGVMRRPALTLTLAVGLLLAAAVPVLDLETGSAGVSTLPDRFVSKRGYLALARDFPAGATSPTQIVIDGDVGSPPCRVRSHACAPNSSRARGSGERRSRPIRGNTWPSSPSRSRATRTARPRRAP